MNDFFRFSFFFSPSCPCCNQNGEAVGRALLNFDEEDAEEYLLNNPEFLATIANRMANRDAEVFDLPRFQLRIRVNQDGIFFSPIPPSDEDQYIDANDDTNGDPVNFEAIIRHLRLHWTVNRTTISFSRLSLSSEEHE